MVKCAQKWEKQNEKKKRRNTLKAWDIILEFNEETDEIFLK